VDNRPKGVKIMLQLYRFFVALADVVWRGSDNEFEGSVRDVVQGVHAIAGGHNRTGLRDEGVGDITGNAKEISYLGSAGVWHIHLGTLCNLLCHHCYTFAVLGMLPT
jgi:hypothetical protein